MVLFLLQAAFLSILISLLRVIVLLLIVYFLAVTMYLFNRFNHVPSLKAIFKVMAVGLKQFFPVLKHRVKLAPARVKHTLTHPREKHLRVEAYPAHSKNNAHATKKKRK